MPDLAPAISSIGPNGQVLTLSPTLTATASDPDNWPNQGLQYDWNICTDSAMTQGCYMSGWTTLPTWSPPAASSSWNVASYYQVTVREGDGTTGTATATSPVGSFTPAVSQPLLPAHFGADPYGGVQDGVNPSIGNYLAAQTDAAEPGAGPPLSVERTYNSLDSRVGAFGQGWSSVYDTSLAVEAATNTVLVSFGDGHQERFGANPDGTWYPGTADFSTLTGNQTIGWTLTAKDGSQHVFTGGGELSSIKDPQGHAITFSYVGGHIARATDLVDGRSLYFGWTSDTPAKIAWVRTDPNAAAGPIPQSYADLVTASGAAGFWRLAEPPGSAAADSSGYGHTGTYTSVSLAQPGPLQSDPATAARMASSSAQVSIPDSASLTTSTYTISAWVKLNAGFDGTWRQLLVKGDGSLADRSYGLWMAPGTNQVLFAQTNSGGTTQSYIYSSELPIGTWTHLVATATPNASMQIYLNGVLDAQGTAGAIVGVAGPVHIGASPTYPAADATLADVALFPTVLAPSTIEDLYFAQYTNQGYRWSYTHNGNLLTTVCSPLSTTQCVNYAYGSSGGADQRLTSITLPRGNTSLSLTYNTDGTIATRTDGTNHTWTYSDSRPNEAGLFHPMNGSRIYNASVTGGTTVAIPAAGVGGIPATGVAALLVNITVASPAVSGWGIGWSTDTGTTPPSPVLSNYFNAGIVSASNSTTIAVGADGKFNYNITSTQTVTFDVYGWYGKANDGGGGAVFNAVSPTRLLDTSSNNTPLGNNETRAINVTNQAGVPATGVKAVALSITATYSAPFRFPPASSDTWLVAYPSNASRPPTSNINAHTGVPVDNLVVTQPGPDGKINLYNAYGPTNVTVDVVGWYGDATQYDGSVFVPVTPVRVLDTRGPDFEYNQPLAANTAYPVTVAGVRGLPAPQLTGIAGTTLTLGTNDFTCQSASDQSCGGNTDYARNTSTWAPTGFHTATGADGAIKITNGAATVHVVLDVSGYFARHPHTTTITDPNAHTEELSFDTQGRLVAHTDALNLQRTFQYDDAGYLWKVTDENGDTSTRIYDNRGNLLSRSDQSGATTVTTYADYYEYGGIDPRNDKIAHQRDARSAGPADDTYATTYAYNPDGTLAAVTTPATPDYPAGRTKTTGYTSGTETAFGGGTMPGGLPYTQTDARGLTTTLNYDSNGDLGQLIAPNGLRTEYAYDELGQRTTSTEYSDTFPAGLTTTFAYTPVGQLATQTDPIVLNRVTNVAHQARTTNTYDPNGNLTSTAIADLTGGDPTHTTTHTYDDAERPASTTDPSGVTTTTSYDPAGLVASRTVTPVTGAAITIEYTHTPRGQQQSATLKQFVDDPIDAPAVNRDVLLESRAYDPAGRLATTTNARGVQTAYTYLIGNQVAATTVKNFHNPNGSTRDIVVDQRTYDPAGHVTTEVTNGGLLTVSNTYDAAGRLTTSTVDPGTGPHLNRTTTLTYDADTNITSRTLTDGTRTEITATTYLADANLPASTAVEVSAAPTWATTTYTYDQRGQLTSRTDPNNNTTGYLTDELARPFETVSPQVDIETNGAAPTPANPTAWVGYDTFGNQTNSKDANGAVTTTTYTNGNAPATVTFPTYTPPGGAPTTPSETIGYDGFGRADAHTDTLGGTTNDVLDMRGRVVQRQAPQVGTDPRQTTRAVYDDNSNITQLTDPNGTVTQAAYDDLDRQQTNTLIERTPTTQNLVTTFGYDDAGDTTSVTDPSGVTRTATFDPTGSQLTATDAGGTTATDYDVAGRPVRVSDPLGRYTTTTYDLAGRATQTQTYDAADVLQTTTQVAYDNAGQVTSLTQPNGIGQTNWSTTEAHDATGRLTSLTTPVSATDAMTETYGYDAAGNRTRRTDGNNNTTITTYNTLGLPESVIEPSTTATPLAADRTWTTSYNAAGEPTTVTQPGGLTASRTYDILGRVTQEQGSGSGFSTLTETYGYDADNRLNTMTLGSSTIATTYNDRGLPTTVTSADSAAAYSYDAAGRTTQTIDAAGASDTTYDNRGLPATTTDPLTGATAVYTYDAAHQLTGISYGASAPTRTFTYDALGRTQTETLDQGATPLWSASYGYDGDSNMISKTTGPASVAGAGTNTYTYDRADRLTKWTDPTGMSLAYGFDKANNRTLVGSTTYSFDQRNMLTAATNGGHTTSMTWSPRGTLTQRSGPARATNAGLVVANTTTPTTAELALQARLIELGFTVTLVADTDTVPAGPDLFVIAPSADPASLGAKYTNLSTPVVDLAPATWPNLNLTDTPSATTSQPTTYVTGTAAMNNGRTGTITIATAPTTLSDVPTGNLGTGATGTLAVAANNTNVVAFTYDTGTSLTSGTAPARRVGLGYSPATINAATPDGWAQIDGAVMWAATKTTTSTVANTFDAFNRLTTDGTSTYTYDALDRIAANGTTPLVWSGLTTNLATDGSFTYTTAPDGTPLGVQQGGGSWLNVSDNHTDQRALVTTSGTLAATKTYDPYGIATASTGIAPTLGYQSQWTDPTTSHVDMNARTYDPTVGQFLSRDSTDDAAMRNRYGYTPANPTGQIDPTGHWATPVACVLATVVAPADETGVGAAVDAPLWSECLSTLPGDDTFQSLVQAIGTAAGYIGDWLSPDDSWKNGAAVVDGSNTVLARVMAQLRQAIQQAANARVAANIAAIRALIQWLQQLLAEITSSGAGAGGGGSGGGPGGGAAGGPVPTPPPWGDTNTHAPTWDPSQLPTQINTTATINFGPLQSSTSTTGIARTAAAFAAAEGAASRGRSAVAAVDATDAAPETAPQLATGGAGARSGGPSCPASSTGNAYSVAFQTSLNNGSYPGASRGRHFQEANTNLLDAMNGDPGFSQAMENLIPGIRDQLQGPRAVSRAPPKGWTWHHASEPGVMQLVPFDQHTAAGPLQDLFHPGGMGGMAIWGC